MNRPEIDGMVRALKPVLKDRTKAKAILERYWTTRMALVWTIGDIHQAANERGLALTRKEAQHLLIDLKTHYNRQLGIKWIDLWELIDSSGMGRKMTKQEINGFVEQCQGGVAKA
jgi:hypothetical protein